MTQATVLFWVLALGLWAAARRRGDGAHRRGALLGWETLRRTLPLLLLAFLIVGLVNALAPQRLVQSWLGPESGLRGLALAEVVGMLLPGGPFVVFPLIATLYQAGAGLGAAVTLVTSWAMLSLLTVTFELPFMGWRFWLVRWGLGLAFPILLGALVQTLMG